MTVVAVADWAPDAAALGNPGAVKAENVFPGPTGYKPFPALDTFSSALDAYPRGAFSTKDDAGVTHLYAGNETKLYRLVSSTWTDSSKVGGYSLSAEEGWEFARWRGKVLAVSIDENPQQITLGGSTFSDLTTAFQARRIAVIRDFVVVGNLNDGGEKRDRVRWSAFGDETDFTVSSVTGSDVRDLNAGGQIQRIFGGEFGVILSERSTWSMNYVGAPTWFRIDEVLPGIGAIAPGAAAQFGSEVYFLSRNGFVKLVGGRQAEYIGVGRVDQTVLADLDNDHLDRMSTIVDPEGNRVIFAYPGAGNTGGRPNKLAIYDRGLNKWSYACVEVELVWQAAGIATTLEDLDAVSASLDDLETSLDSSRWKGGSASFSAFDSTFKHGGFSGSPLSAVIETREIEPNAGFRTTFTAMRPLVDGGAVSGRLGVRSDPTQEVAWKTGGALRPGGRLPVRGAGRYARAELTLTGNWSDVVGVRFDPADAKPSGRRG